MVGGAAVRYWVRRDLRRRRRPALVLAALTALAAVVPFVAAAGARRTASAFDRMDRELEPVHLNVQFEGEDGPPADALERLSRVPGVARVAEGASILASPVGLDRPPFESFGQGAVRGGVIREFDRPRMKDGRLPTAPDEALASSELAAGLALRPGSTFTIRTYSPEAIDRVFAGEQVGFDGPQVELRVTGIGDPPESITGGGASESAPVASLFIVPPAFFETWRDRVHFFDGIFLMRLHEGVAPDEARRRVRAAFADRPDMTAYPSELSSRVEESVAAQTAALALLAAVALLGGLVVVAQAARRFARGAEDDEAVGRAIGFTHLDVVLARVASAVTPVVAGLVLAGGLALLLSGAYPTGVAGRLEPEPGPRPDPVVHAAMAATLLAAVVAGVALLARGRRAETAAPPAGRRLPLAAPGPSSLVGLRSLGSRVPRRPSAAQSAMVACTAGLAGLVAALVFGHSLDRLVQQPSRFGWNWDLSVALGDELTDGEAGEQAARVVDDDRVGAAVLARLATRVLDGREVSSIGLEPVKGALGLTVVRGRAVRSDGEVVLGATTMDELDRGIGSVVEAAGPGGEPVPLRVVGQALFPVEENDDPTRGAGMTLAAMARLQGTDGFPNLYVALAPGATRAEFEAAAAEHVASISGMTRPGLVVNLDNVDQTPYVLAAYLGVLAAAATAHALLSAIRRRRRDLSVLKALGFVRRQVAQAVLVEGAAVVIVGLLLGLPAGLVLGRSVWTATAARLGVATDPVSPLPALLLLVPAAFGLALAVSLVPAAMAGRTHPAGGLREE